LVFPGHAELAVHTIVDGEVHVWTDDPGAALRLLPGDVVLVREHTEHRIAHVPGADCIALADAMGPGAGVSRQMTAGEPEDGPPIAFFCGAYRFEGDLCDSLLTALPDTLSVRPVSGSTLRATMDLLAREMLNARPGQQTLLDRLLDVALVQILREHFSVHASRAPGWFRASADPRIGAALRALHADPAHAWTVAELAQHALLSRSAFARQFTDLLGTAPLTYLGAWRMALAREQLRDTDDSLAAVANSLGYASEFSFAAAFKRHHGTSPGRWRRQQSAAVETT
jgi:AraC-like DNA-binding protein